ncbi:Maf family protein [Acidithiobacillus concretivorus]|uniref:dTTP/UTP pyrophosphatase n=1 Tax=Acidithiobacillus concretivorus TaxID=3063952 RepID=A0ABS5ZPF0_9PROT|nr:septum formation inhibitor Maf [Acidithiobacillus concretivorus]
MSKLILASASPRRLALLRQLGYDPQVQVADVDETPQAGECPERLVQRLARSKATALAGSHPENLILAADTVVALAGQAFGKARDAAEAYAMYAQLGGKDHQVHTAVALLHDGQVYELLHSSTVRLRSMSPQEMADYWASGEPADKAGAYAIQGLGAIFVEHLQGSFSGVMGLPLFETARLLSQCGFPPPAFSGST